MTEAAGIELDRETRTASACGRKVALSPSEFAILETLAAADSTVSTDSLRATIRSYGHAQLLSPKSDPLKVLVRRLRLKLQAAGIRDAIRTVHGYALATESQGEDAAGMERLVCR